MQRQSVPTLLPGFVVVGTSPVPRRGNGNAKNEPGCLPSLVEDCQYIGDAIAD
jgi:hypothetical protein